VPLVQLVVPNDTPSYQVSAQILTVVASHTVPASVVENEDPVTDPEGVHVVPARTARAFTVAPVPLGVTVAATWICPLPSVLAVTVGSVISGAPMPSCRRRRRIRAAPRTG